MSFAKYPFVSRHRQRGDEDKPADEVYFVYRTILPHQFERNASKPRSNAFLLRNDNERSLSVWDSRIAAPRMLLQQYLDNVNTSLANDDEAKRKKLSANGATPEEMYEKGWRIVRLTEAAFVSLSLIIEPARSDGHRDVIGTMEDFRLSADALVEASEVLTKEETLS